MNKCVNKLLPNDTKIEVEFKSNKLSSYFNVKDRTDFEHNHYLIYHTKYPDQTCIDDYVGESARRIIERIKDPNGRDDTSHALKHSIEKSHKNVKTIDFKIIDKNFHNNKQKQECAEALWIKDLRPTLNTQEKSIQIKFLIDYDGR